MSHVQEVLALTAKNSCQDGVNFTSYNLKGIGLKGVTFIFADLSEAILDRSDLAELNFSQAILPKSSFKKAKAGPSGSPDPLHRTANTTPRQTTITNPATKLT